MYPQHYRYTKEHEWIRVEGDIGVIGITDYAQRELGDVVYVELPAVGEQLVAGKVMGSVESVKAVSDIYSPVSGEVIEVNSALVDAPEKLNEDPHGEAWLVKVRLQDPKELDQLLTAEQYEAYIQGAQNKGDAGS